MHEQWDMIGGHVSSLVNTDKANKPGQLGDVSSRVVKWVREQCLSP